MGFWKGVCFTKKLANRLPFVFFRNSCRHIVGLGQGTSDVTLGNHRFTHTSPYNRHTPSEQRLPRHMYCANLQLRWLRKPSFRTSQTIIQLIQRELTNEAGGSLERSYSGSDEEKVTNDGSDDGSLGSTNLIFSLQGWIDPLNRRIKQETAARKKLGKELKAHVKGLEAKNVEQRTVIRTHSNFFTKVNSHKAAPKVAAKRPNDDFSIKSDESDGRHYGRSSKRVKSSKKSSIPSHQKKSTKY
eukprot:scaffold620_cov169-Amphora_coffeaeformis.AAC.27